MFHHHHHDHGMVTAEFSVGTLGAVMIASVLYKLGMLDGHNPWLDAFKDILERALAWGKLQHFIPGLGIKLG